MRIICTYPTGTQYPFSFHKMTDAQKAYALEKLEEMARDGHLVVIGMTNDKKFYAMSRGFENDASFETVEEAIVYLDLMMDAKIRLR